MRQEEDTTSESTEQSTEIIVPNKWKQSFNDEQKLDEYISKMCLEYPISSMLQARAATNARTYYAASLIYNAIFDMDMGLINQIANRIDGTVPNSEDRDSYANIFGDALEDVMDYDSADQFTIFPTDSCIIALAKATYVIATSEVGTNVQKKKDRQLANDLILNRCGGKKTEPTRPLIETVYVEPDWMKGLPDNNEY